MRHVSTRKIPIKFFMIEGTTQTRIDIMNLPEHSKKSCTGKNRRKVLQNLQKKSSQFSAENFFNSKNETIIFKNSGWKIVYPKLQILEHLISRIFDFPKIQLPENLISRRVDFSKIQLFISRKIFTIFGRNFFIVKNVTINFKKKWHGC